MKHYALHYLCVLALGLCSLSPSSHGQQDEVADFASYQLKMLLQEAQKDPDDDSEKPESVAFEQQTTLNCDKHVALIHDLLKFIPGAPLAGGQQLSRIQQHALKQLVDYSLQKNFDHDCYRWQHDLLAALTLAKIGHAEYRHNLFAIIAAEHKDIAASLLIDVLDYALKTQPLTPPEWRVVVNAMQHANHLTARQVLAHLVNATQPLENKEALSASAFVQDETRFIRQVDTLIEQLDAVDAYQSQSSMTLNYFITMVLSQAHRQLPSSFNHLYLKHRHRLTSPGRLAPYMGLYLAAKANAKRQELVALYFSDLVERSVRSGHHEAKSIMTFLDKLEQRTGASVGVKKFLSGIVNNHEAFVRSVVKHPGLPLDRRDHWLAYIENPAD